MSQSWFSSRIRLVVLIEGGPASHFADSIILFRAADFEDAFQRALVLGRKREQEYVGGEGKRVRWRLKEIVSLDIIDGDELDGVEIYSESADFRAGDQFAFETTFLPDESKPGQTI